MKNDEISEEDKSWIDNASYEELLSRWRFAPCGTKIFQGRTGDYFQQTMMRKKKEIGDDEAVRISKRIGWER